MYPVQCMYIDVQCGILYQVCASGEIEDAITAISSSVKDCTVVFYDTINSAKIETLCVDGGATHHRVITLSSVVRCEGMYVCPIKSYV